MDHLYSFNVDQSMGSGPLFQSIGRLAANSIQPQRDRQFFGPQLSRRAHHLYVVLVHSHDRQKSLHNIKIRV